MPIKVNDYRAVSGAADDPSRGNPENPVVFACTFAFNAMISDIHCRCGQKFRVQNNHPRSGQATCPREACGAKTTVPGTLPPFPSFTKLPTGENLMSLTGAAKASFHAMLDEHVRKTTAQLSAAAEATANATMPAPQRPPAGPGQIPPGHRPAPGSTLFSRGSLRRRPGH